MGVNFHPLPPLDSTFIGRQKYFLLFETSLFDEDNLTSYIFTEPLEIIRVTQSSEIAPAFNKIEEYSKKYFLAGCFAYELGYYFENKFAIKENFDFPLIHLGVFERELVFDHKSGTFRGDPSRLLGDESEGEFAVENLKFDLTREAYVEKISAIKEHIKRGETYQVNFTGRYRFYFSGDPFAFYKDLRSRQRVPYGAFCKFGEECHLSLSPELFFRMEGRSLLSKPMKGTMRRGKDLAEDRTMALKLRRSGKERAENLMIVDLIRNDLGRICESGSVKVPELFRAEKYETLFQMTSTVEGRLKKGATWLDLFRAVFPGGSVTGAPKIRTMQIIRDLEESPRKLYCGALGLISPGGKAVFNIPIRTVSLSGGFGEMGAGSGIIYEADPGREFEECLLKANFLTQRPHPFKLIETLRWEDGYHFLKEHLGRMRKSARYFSFAWDEKEVLGHLRGAARKFTPGSRLKVRLLLSKEGKIEIESSELPEDDGKSKLVRISPHRTDPEDPFLRHKTTNRRLYEEEYRMCRARGDYEVLFLNVRGEVTEGAVSNIFICKGGHFYTPPCSCGLLPGIFRHFSMGELQAEERVLSVADLMEADHIYLTNSVRGRVEVRLKVIRGRVGSPPGPSE